MKPVENPQLIRDVWLSMMQEVPIEMPPLGAPYVSLCGVVDGKPWTTPIGLLCQVSQACKHWPYASPPEELEHAPAHLIRAVGLQCRTNQIDEAAGHDVDWINAMTDAGASFPVISTTIRLLQAEREEQKEIAS